MIPSFGGFGLGLRKPHYADFLDTRVAVDFVEVISENFMVAGGRPLHILDQVRERWPDLPILFMSGYAEEQLRNSIDLANVAFLPKPFSVNQLAEAARDALAMRTAAE